LDVSVYDSTSEISANGESADVAIIEMSDVAVEPLLRSLATTQPGIRVLALKALGTTVDENVVAESGVRRFEMCSPTVTPTELVSRAQQLLRD
jgi:hypothetical protein